MAHPFEFLWGEWEALERYCLNLKDIVQYNALIPQKKVNLFRSRIKYVRNVLANLTELTLHEIHENNKRLAEQDNVKDNPGQS